MAVHVVDGNNLCGYAEGSSKTAQRDVALINLILIQHYEKKKRWANRIKNKVNEFTLVKALM